MRPQDESAWLTSLTIVLGAALLCTSCGRGLPTEPVFIVGRSTTHHSPDGRVYTCLGAKTSMRAGDREIALMHILILPPATQDLVDATTALDEGVPEVLRFDWRFSVDTTAKLTFSYDPEMHAVTVAGHRYPLSKGNLFVVTISDKGSPEVRQLGRTLFECLEAREALATFKRELPNSERVHKIRE